MIISNGETQVHDYLAAVRRAIDPNRTVLAASTPYVVAGSIGPADRQTIVAGTLASNGADADYVHLEFEPGTERDGPVNVVVGMVRAGVCHIRQSCRFWLGANGRMALVATVGPKAATMTFDPDGMDSRPGRPRGDLEAGYARAATRLRKLAATPASAQDTVTFRFLRAA